MILKISTIKTALLSGLFILFLSLFLINSSPRQASAAYDGGRLIDNSVFLNSVSMTASDIQNFLTARGGAIANKTFAMDCTTAGAQANSAYIALVAPCGQTVYASTIIYYTAQVYGVNPKVILATMQKEQSLITAVNPTNRQYVQAMGYGCPTTGSCDDASNFFWQVDNGTWVLRFHYERARGNMSWWYTSTTWTCGTEKNFYKPNLYPGQNVNFYDEDGVMYRTNFIVNAATSSFYCYTPHAYNNPQGLYGRAPFGTVGRYYSGSYNFVLFYELWFGPTTLPYAFKSSTSPTIYYQVDGYRVAVPAMGILQDYGISPESIATISQATLDSIPVPPPSSGISPNLGYLVKSLSDTDSDGASVYVISIGKKYQVTSMEQFNDFGFNTSQITYLPISNINGLQSGGQLSNFVQAPNLSVFRVDSGAKNIIFEYNTYRSLNPSNSHSAFSYYLVNQIASGAPLTDKDTLVKMQGSEAVYLYTNSTYYNISTYEAFQCWGFQGNLAMPLYRVMDNSYISTITPAGSISSCVQNFDNTLVILNNSKIEVPQSFGLSLPAAPVQNIRTILAKIPPRSNPLKQYLRSFTNPSVWYISGGLRNSVPTYNNFVKLGLTSNTIDFIPDTALQQIPVGGIKLGPGTLVKNSSSSSVYVVSDNSRLLYSTSDDFLAYKNNWSEIETYQDSILNNAYPYNNLQINKYFYDSTSNKTYLVDVNGCYTLSTETLTKYGILQSQIATQQTYSKNIFENLNLANCRQGSEFVKSPSQNTVYQIVNGQKKLITKWQTLISLSGTTNPNVSILAESSLSTFPTGSQLD